MEHLLRVAWPEVRPRIQKARHILLACDFDGTLTPIVPRPELVELPETTRNALRALSAAPRYTVAVVSGRSLADVRAQVGLPEVLYAGNHGMEIEGPDDRHTDPEVLRARSVMDALVPALRKEMSAFDGTIVEDKGLSVSVHYRLVEPDVQAEIVQRVRRVVQGAPDAGDVVLREGKKILEVRLALSWDKGRALTFLFEAASRAQAQPPLPIYLGDDVTDEDAFRDVNRLGGLAVVVGLEGRSSIAPYRLDSTTEVGDLLEQLLLMEKEAAPWKP